MTAPDGKRTDALDYWKRPVASPDEAARIASMLAGSCIARHGPGLGPHLAEAASDAEAALSLSRRAEALGLRDDEARSWVWVAACLGSPVAAADIAAILAIEGAMGGDDGDLCRRLSADWFARRDAQAARLPGAVPGDPISAAEAVEKALPASRPRGVAIRAVGDPDSEAGEDLRRRYGPIVGVPLPLRGVLPEPGDIRREMLLRWPWATLAAEAVEGHLAALRLGSGMRRLPNLLLVGPGGSGKSDIAEWLPRRLGMHVHAMGQGGGREAILAIPRGLPGACPGAVAQAMLAGACRNPVVVVDRVDAAATRVLDDLCALVGAASHRDACLLSEVDASAVAFLATARSRARLPRRVLELFEVVGVPRPSACHLPALRATATADFCAAHGIAPEALPPLRPDAIARLEGPFMRGDRSVRSYAGRIARILSAAAAAAEPQPRDPGRAAAIRRASLAEPPGGTIH